MPFSGTSIVARLLRELGLDLGPEEELLPEQGKIDDALANLWPATGGAFDSSGSPSRHDGTYSNEVITGAFAWLATPPLKSTADAGA